MWKKLREADPTEAQVDGWTHACNVCQRGFKLDNNTNGSWVITPALRHFKKVHPLVLKTLNAGTKKKKTQNDIRSALQRQAVQVAQRTAAERVQAARNAIGRFYIYCRQKISKGTVEDTSFRNMVKRIAEVPTGHVGKLDMSSKALLPIVQTEFEHWLAAFKKFIDLSLEKSKGNPFAQGLHDCVTLKSGKKFLAVGMSCMDPWLDGNYTITLGFVPVKSSAAVNIGEALDQMCISICGRRYATICHSTMSDFAAINVADVFDHDREGCAMHGDDKTARYAIGDIQHSRGGRPADPFVEGKALVTKVQKCATHFSYSNRRQQLAVCGNDVAGGCPNIVPKTDISTTRVAARHSMIVSVLLLNRALRRYADAFDPGWKLTIEEWRTLAEMEAVLQTITTVTTLVQSERAQMGAMGYLIHVRLMERLRGTEFAVYDLDAITATARPRRPKAVAEFSDLGRLCLLRARMEAERRLCGSRALTTVGITGAPVICSDRQLLCVFLDPRTHHLFCGRHWDRDQKLAAQRKLRDHYVRFFLNAARPTANLTRPPSGDDDDDELLVACDDEPARQPRALFTMAEWEANQTALLRTQFKAEFSAYSAYLLREVDWKAYGVRHGIVGIPAAAADIDPVQHLLNLDIVPLIKDLPSACANIQLLLTHSKASVASVPAVSYAERINSAAGVVSTKGNVRLNVDEISHLVPLRMNGPFFGVLCDKLRALQQQEVVDVE